MNLVEKVDYVRVGLHLVGTGYVGRGAICWPIMRRLIFGAMETEKLRNWIGRISRGPNARVMRVACDRLAPPEAPTQPLKVTFTFKRAEDMSTWVFAVSRLSRCHVVELRFRCSWGWYTFLF